MWDLHPLNNAAPNMRIAKEEIFGPLLSVIPLDSDDDAVAIGNGKDYGLAAGLSTADLDRAHWIAEPTAWTRARSTSTSGMPAKWGRPSAA